MEAYKATLGKSSSGLSIFDALFNPQYRTATWVNVWYIIFHELTGINVILQYSNTMFHQMESKGASFTPRQGTFMVGIINTVAGLTAIWLVKRVGRRPLTVWGHSGMALCHLAIALFNN